MAMGKPVRKAAKRKPNKQIIAKFYELWAEQIAVENKLSEVEMDLNEHRLVIDALSHVDRSRKCFFIVGGVQTERTVGEVVPELESIYEKLPVAERALENQLSRKGKQISTFIRCHKIRVQDHPAKKNMLVTST